MHHACWRHACLAATLALAAPAALAQDADWFPSEYGADDTLGAANRLGPDKVLAAAELITTGQVYRLGVPVGRDTPAFPPRSLAVTILMPNQFGGTSLGSNGMSYVDDMFNGWLGIGTQIDSLAHLGIDGVFYNGNKAPDFISTTGVTKLGIENIPPIVTRGVLIDAAAHAGVERMEAGQVITAEDLQAAMAAQSVTINEGDVVVIHTGWLSMLYEDAAAYGAGEPGIDVGAAEFLAEQKPVAVGADTWGIEAVPFATDRIWEGHQTLLAKNGIYILETLDTRALIADGVQEFFFALGQPLYTGAVQAIINPLAIR